MKAREDDVLSPAPFLGLFGEREK